MKAMVLKEIGSPLELTDLPPPQPKENEVLLQVICCAVCRTDLHIIDGDLKEPKLPLVPGHQIVGKVIHSRKHQVGSLVGVPWVGQTCGKCSYCLHDQENLCDNAIYTGYQRDGGFAEYCKAHEDYVFPIPPSYSPLQASPLLCAGLIGYRALRLIEGAKNIGFYGFGSAAHLLVQVVNHRGGKVFAFIRNREKGDFVKKMGATWVGAINDQPPLPLDAAILFAPTGEHYPIALKAVKKGGTVISAGIHMSDIPAFPYSLLWGERVMRTVSNLTREDGHLFLNLAPKIPIHTEITVYSLPQVNEALSALRTGHLKGTAVIQI
jgi:propanol-preferring alcohol dehydrogenase